MYKFENLNHAEYSPDVMYIRNTLQILNMLKDTSENIPKSLDPDDSFEELKRDFIPFIVGLIGFDGFLRLNVKFKNLNENHSILLGEKGSKLVVEDVIQLGDWLIKLLESRKASKFISNWYPVDHVCTIFFE